MRQALVSYAVELTKACSKPLTPDELTALGLPSLEDWQGDTGVAARRAPFDALTKALAEHLGKSLLRRSWWQRAARRRSSKRASWRRPPPASSRM